MSEPTRPSLFQRVDNFVRGVANGATFGLADKFAGTMNSIGSDKTISDNIAAETARSAHAARTDNGYFVGEVAGALGTGGAAFNATSKAIAAATSDAALTKGVAAMAGITAYTSVASVSSLERIGELRTLPTPPAAPESSSPQR